MSTQLIIFPSPPFEIWQQWVQIISPILSVLVVGVFSALVPANCIYCSAGFSGTPQYLEKRYITWVPEETPKAHGSSSPM